MTETVTSNLTPALNTHLSNEFGFDPRLLTHLSQSIGAAHRANPNSWSLSRIQTGTLVLFVEQFWVLSVRHDGGDLRFFGNSEDFELEGVATFNIDSHQGITLTGLTSDDFDRIYIDQREQHEAFIANRASAVKTRTQRANDHNPDLVDHLAQTLQTVLPQPLYEQEYLPTKTPNPKKYRSRSQQVTGFWKQTVDDSTWERFLEQQELTSTLWNEPTEDLGTWPDDRREFTKLAEQRENYSDGASHRLWMFVKGMQIGDQIIAHAGPKNVLGVGEITSDYAVVDGRHRRSVSWTNTEAVPIKRGLIAEATGGQNLWGLTPLEKNSFGIIATALGIEGYESKESGSLPEIAGAVSAFSLSNHFTSAGLTYTTDQIATFYTALQTKGFVVLSGISGTGKSKIAQGFVEMLPNPSSESQPPEIDHESVIQLSIKPYTRKYRRVVIPVGQLGTLPPISAGDQLIVPLKMSDSRGSGRLVGQLHPAGNTVTYLYFRGEIADRIKQLELDTPLYLVPESRTDDESLDSITLYTDAAELPDEVVVKTSEGPNNSLFLAVRPDWRDSTSLLGYYNPLTQTYEWTEFLRFLLRAKESFRQKDGLAWFVILDEMNLAHVEYYFADLLSIIESGRDDDGWSREAIRLTFPDTLTDNAPPHEIKLPPNLYIIGTVNMDETTHTFSPKVLDRAFTIELTNVSFADYPPVAATAEQEIPDEERQTLLTAFTRNKRFAIVDKNDIRAAVDNHPDIRTWLDTLNARLATHQFHFGYRVFDEIAQFIFNADENRMFVADGVDEEIAWIRAFDHAVYMKVLPKFNGSHARLHGPLTVLLDWAMEPANPSWGWAEKHLEDEQIVKDALLENAALGRVAKRAMRMLEILEANGFVSFG
jgi:hypothetical protein